MRTSTLTDVRDHVSARALAALGEHTARFAEVGAPVEEFLHPARELLSGGKRLRAQLCAAGWLAAGHDRTSEAVVLAGSALELFQATALVHDDVMDGSATRRGLPAAHRRFAGDHTANAWLGDADSYGTAAAIVLGDLLLALSAMELERARDLVPPAAGRRAREIYDVMTAEVALGQYLDIRSQDLPWRDDGEELTRALQVVRHKSARYSVEHPLVLGAALGGGDDDLLAALSAVGLPLGEAFQLRDDELGVFGDPAVTGKPAGDDLREGKRTALVALTAARVDATDRADLRGRLGRADLGPAEVRRVQDLIVASGALAEHGRLVEERYGAALRALAEAHLPEHAGAAIAGLAEALTRRDA